MWGRLLEIFEIKLNAATNYISIRKLLLAQLTLFDLRILFGHRFLL